MSVRAGLLPFLLLLGACVPDPGPGPDADPDFNDMPPLSELDPLYEGWPGNDKLPSEGKADEVYPSKFDGPMAWQSPIRDQGYRGVCSIFSAIGLMEHLYIKEGTIPNPDFSEQFLQWSVKVELGRFQDNEGSSSTYNLQALDQFGVVEEHVYPYESRPWTSANDPACTGNARPVQCYTNGHPPEEVLDAQRFHLPRGRWISSRRDSIKSHMVRTNEAVVVGGSFYYQAWNHGASTLPTDRSLFRKGIVTFPNAADKKASEESPAGHSFVLVGWDDDLAVPVRDGDGKIVQDANGDPVMEKGFFLFRNSWGTDSFGVENPYGAGYGWISMDYVEQYLTAYVSALPKVELFEVCGDGEDNDRDGAIDCDDSDCATDPACTGATEAHTWDDGPVAIPDNNAGGIIAEIEVEQDGIIESLAVTVDITHTYRGDLEVALFRNAEDFVMLHERTGGAEDDLKQTYVLSDFNGLEARGTYSLLVSDHSAWDTGRLNRWSLEIATGGEPNVEVYRSSEQVTIPDNDPTGAFSNLQVDGTGTIRSLKAVVNIDHDYRGDLTLRLQRIGQPGEVTLVEADASSGPFGTRSFPIGAFLGEEAAGTWRLLVIDEARGDQGTLLGWSLEIGY